MNIKNMKLLNGALFAALASVFGTAGASITSEETITFEGMGTLQFVAGKANLAPAVGGNCPGTGSAGCYYEGSFAVGIVNDTSNPSAHVHKPPGIGRLQYHSDSSGIYIRALDGTAFSLTQMDFHAPFDPSENPDAGPNAASSDYWEILGFNTALNDGSSPQNPNLDTGNGTDYPSRVAYQTIANGFDGTLLLNSGFQSVNAIWIHYHGYPQTPADGKAFAMELDNVVLNAPPGGSLSYSEVEAALDTATLESGGKFIPFDENYFAETYSASLAGYAGTPLQYYVEQGAAKGFKPNAWFNAGYYRASYPDFQSLHGADLLTQYAKFGVNEGRSPSPVLNNFDGARYLNENPDVNAYVQAYLNDFKTLDPATGQPVSDAQAAKQGAIAHYIKFGAAEGRIVYDTSGALISFTM